MSKFHQSIEAGRAIFASVLCLLSVVLLAPAAQAAAKPTITGVKAAQRYPWNGKVDIEYTVSGLAKAAEAKGVLPYLTVMAIDCATTPWTTNYADLACLSIGPDEATKFSDAEATKDGVHRLVWDLDRQHLSQKSTNVVFAVMGEDDVQLWANGPFWSQCNVGATKPEEYGYYFWWGDTVGYKRNESNNGWVSVKDGNAFSFDFRNCRTYGKSNSQLQSDGYIDDTGNLVATNDAATVHLGAPWRMPTNAEMTALTDNCTSEWMKDWNKTGVAGCVITGKGAYSGRSIFLPAASGGYDSYLYRPGSYGFYWSSSPDSDDSLNAWCLYFASGNFGRSDNNRDLGQSVRPLRGFAK